MGIEGGGRAEGYGGGVFRLGGEVGGRGVGGGGGGGIAQVMIGDEVIWGGRHRADKSAHQLFNQISHQNIPSAKYFSPNIPSAISHCSQ